ncbi:HBR505Wp [Eremothecium sinecaudum]|uniref:Phosphatidylserine decarboxylase proenzyme 1, mitochondrial n=1 Tax=Eremothecium sinecaudum TaxID=45286 RepID=A0A109UXL7_9SACH|nr:HBR505Wp [Eremothecium sinecaudum]AMD19406.1 HBR505Wp [Eremothecium sinecaudum]
MYRTRNLKLNKNVSHSSWKVARRGLDAGMKLKKKTNDFIWYSRYYYSSVKDHGKQSREESACFGSCGTGRNGTMAKWFLMTGVTLVLGSLLISQQKRRIQLNKEKERTRIRIFDNNWLFFCYSTLPLNAISRLWGQVNSLTLPVWLRPLGFRLYAVLFGVNIDEMVETDLSKYENLSQFFYRKIKPECRPIDERENIVVCPSDGRVLQLGVIDSDTGDIGHIKGMIYSVKDLLGTHSHPMINRDMAKQGLLSNENEEDEHKEFARVHRIPHFPQEIVNDTPTSEDTDPPLNPPIQYNNEGDKLLPESSIPVSKTMKLLGELSSHYVDELSSSDPKNTQLYFAVIYLAPGDYHHYHSPVNWVCKLRRHFPGELFSVSPYFQKNFPKLFILNERVALLGHWKYGFFSMTPVGATNVGSIKLNFDKDLVTNSKSNRHTKPNTCYEATYETASKILKGVPLEKGEEMGGFMLGSTVVLCFEAPSTFQFEIKLDDVVKIGQPLGKIH